MLNTLFHSVNDIEDLDFPICLRIIFFKRKDNTTLQIQTLLYVAKGRIIYILPNKIWQTKTEM